MSNVVRLREDVDTLPCEVEFDRRILTQVHIANSAPTSALDGYAPRKVRHISAGTVIAIAILAPSAIALAISFGRWVLR